MSWSEYASITFMQFYSKFILFSILFTVFLTLFYFLENENSSLKFMLKSYYEHIVRYPQTLITRFFGLHKIKLKTDGGFQRIYFIIMANVFNTTLPIEKRYDLKGSKQGRLVKKTPE